MCYFITTIVPENFLKEKTVKTPRGLELTPMENPSVQKRILKNEIQLALTSGGCSCDLYSVQNECDAEEPSQPDYSKKYAKKGWSKAKIARALSSRSQAEDAKPKDDSKKQIPDIVTDYLKEIVQKYGRVTAEGLVESALDKVRIIEELGYDRMVISIKSSDVLMCIRAHELIAEQTDYPLHVGITEAGTVYSGTIKSSVGLGVILAQGIGDTIRVSLTGDPVEEVRVGKRILQTLGLRRGNIEVVSCPTCGRTQIDLISLANNVERLVEGIPLDIKVAVMGCVVNGPGEAAEADLGICGGKGMGLLIRHGEIIRKVPESELLGALEAELRNWIGER